MDGRGRLLAMLRAVARVVMTFTASCLSLEICVDCTGGFAPPIRLSSRLSRGWAPGSGALLLCALCSVGWLVIIIIIIIIRIDREYEREGGERKEVREEEGSEEGHRGG